MRLSHFARVQFTSQAPNATLLGGSICTFIKYLLQRLNLLVVDTSMCSRYNDVQWTNCLFPNQIRMLYICRIYI